ncbi:flagellin [Texcoconibacillus texcoconensis]
MEADVSAAVMDEANQELTIENPSVECEVVGEGAGISEGAELTFAQRVEEHVAGEYTVTVGDFNSDEQTATITVEDPNGKTETLPNQDLTSDITAAGLTIPGDAIEGDGDFTVDMSRSVQTNWDTVEDEDEIIADGGNIRLADSTDETSLGEYTIDVEETFFQTWAETITVTDPDGDTHTVTSEDPGEDIEVAGLVIEADTLTNENSGTEGGKVVIDIDGDITEGSSVSGANIADDAVTFGHREEEHQLGEYRINVSNYDSNNNTATIEVERPDGSTEEVTDQELDGEFIIGGLEINENLISGDGSATVRMQPDGETIIGEREMRTENGRFEYNGVEFTFDGSVANDPEDVDFSIENNALAFQIGPNAGQDVLVDIPKMDVEELGLDELDVTSQRSANDGISILDGAITQVSDARATLGAMQNRMEHTVNNLQVTSENLTAAESRIRDTDMAEEMTEFTRNNILNQSGTAMLAQANQLPQGVLELLQ